MCFSAPVSFAMAGILVTGGAFCSYNALQRGFKYLALAIMPAIVGIQQFMEGLVWIGADLGDHTLLYRSALSYMFFVWVFWPSWVPFMTAQLENDIKKKKILFVLSGTGAGLGLIFYLPYFIYPDWFNVEIVCHSINYKEKLIPDQFIPRPITAAIYLALVGATPLLSSHRPLRIFGWSLIIFVPITHLVYTYAYTSVLCFFAALATVQIIFIITGKKCEDDFSPLAIKSKKTKPATWN